jgi:DNA uptake protein ComE-like DNA-binding protein
MEAIRRQSGDFEKAGSALLLTVVLTVLLSLIGVLFVMAARLDEMGTSSIADERELSAAVDSVVGRVSTVLVDDLFGSLRTGKLADGTSDNERFDSPAIDLWLASLEPEWVDAGIDPIDRSDDNYQWRRVSNIYGLAPLTIFPIMVTDSSGTGLADADGDGVSDSVWVMMPNLKDSKGRYIYAAVRVIDNCAMLNLNTAYAIDADSEGRFLSSVDYIKFLRGDDRLEDPWTPDQPTNIDRIRLARVILEDINDDSTINLTDYYGPEGRDFYTPERYHNEAIMNIERPGGRYVLFDIGDELEIRNRYLLTSLTQAHFERGGVVGLDVDVAYETFDYGRGLFTGGWNTAIRSRRVPFTLADFDAWKWRVHPDYFADNPYLPVEDHYKYDRRHVCTFYSFDRNLRAGVYPVLEGEVDSYLNIILAGVADADIKEKVREKVRGIFFPKGAATTNIESPFEPDPLNAGSFLPSFNNPAVRKKMVHLLYALRAYFIAEESLSVEEAAGRSAQYVANMIDYIDNRDPTTEGPFYRARFGDGVNGQRNQNLTYVNRAIIRELILEASGIALVEFVDPAIPDEIDIDFAGGLDFGLDADEMVYGYERQPFISELYTNWDGDAGGCQAFAIELVNPYPNPNGLISLEGWRIKIGGNEYDLTSDFSVAEAVDEELGRLVIWGAVEGFSVPASGEDLEIDDFGLGMVLSGADVVELQRPDPADEDEYITVDKTGQGQLERLREDGIHASKRDDTGWKFADMSAFDDDSSPTLGEGNGMSLGSVSHQMSVADNQNPVGTLGDFERVILFSNKTESDDPNSVAKTVTEYMASADSVDESTVRFDLSRDDVNRNHRELLKYICFLNRDKGTLPGRINVNTATREVMRAAIPPKVELWDPNDLSADIVTYRNTTGPFADIMDLLKVPGFDSLASDPNEDVGDLLVRGDIEERDWILSRVSNIFTVRSDVFTAYILVRLGEDGPERRVIAIFDRSNVDSPMDKPRVIAVHPVPAVR